MSELLKKGLSEHEKCDKDPKEYGMDNMPDSKGQKPMATPKKTVKEKGKSFTIR